jgi:hypothetical protein
MSDLIPVDITRLSPSEVAAIESNPEQCVQGENGVFHAPSNMVRKKVIKIKLTKATKALVERYPGVKVLTNDGKVNYRKLPTDEVLRRMVRRKGDARENMFEQLGKPYCLKLVEKGLPKSDLKLKTKGELKKQIWRWAYKPADKKPRSTRPDKTRAHKRGKDEASGPKNKEDSSLL